MEYLQQLQNKILAENTALLKDTEGSQIMESKYEEVISEDKEQ